MDSSSAARNRLMPSGATSTVPLSPSSKHFARIASAVAGAADILVVPDLESGNMLAKQLEYLAGATGSGLVLGARVPIALTSRADGPMARVASALLGQLAAYHARAERARQGGIAVV